MWLNELKNLYRCYINLDGNYEKHLINTILINCLNELDYDLFGISYNVFLKDYDNISLEDLPVEVREMFINFNNNYKNIINSIDNSRGSVITFSDVSFESSLKDILIFIYSVSRVKEIK